MIAVRDCGTAIRIPAKRRGATATWIRILILHVSPDFHDFYAGCSPRRP